MRARIFSIVLLPAPLRPMMPTVSPARISNETSFSAQNSFDGRPARAVAPGRESRDVLAERAVACDALGRAESVALADPLGADGESQMTSAKKCSTRRK